MRIVNLVVAILAFIEAGWMAFDGGRALLVGDYVTPKTGPHAGQLGAWSKLVSPVGIEPKSTLMKSIFLVYGLLWLSIIVCFLLKVSWAIGAMLIAAFCSLWYLPIGTVLSTLQIILIIIQELQK